MSSRLRASTPSAFDEEATYRPHQRTHLAASPSPPTVLLRPRQHLPPLVAYRLPPRAAAPHVGYVLAPLVPEPIDLHLPPPLPAALTIEMAVQDDGADWLAVRTAVQEDAAVPAEGERETPQGPDPGGREGADMDGADAGGSFLPETPARHARPAPWPRSAPRRGHPRPASARHARPAPWPRSAPRRGHAGAADPARPPASAWAAAGASRASACAKPTAARPTRPAHPAAAGLL